MTRPDQFNLEYITDDSGARKAVIVPLDIFKQLLSDMETLATLQKRGRLCLSPIDENTDLGQGGLLADWIEVFSEEASS